MGFTEEQVKSALEAFDNDRDLTMQYLTTTHDVSVLQTKGERSIGNRKRKSSMLNPVLIAEDGTILKQKSKSSNNKKSLGLDPNKSAAEEVIDALISEDEQSNDE